MITLRAGSVASAEIEVKRSRFIATVSRTSSEEEARLAIDLERERFPDARHHCSAYIICEGHVNPLLRSSDDGEPSGTAGRPILDALLHADLGDVCAVVTRYFGGTLLGTGGLVRAYGSAVQEALSAAPLVRVDTFIRYRTRVPAMDGGRVEAAFRDAGWNVVEAVWSDYFELEIAAKEEDLPQLNGDLSTLLQRSAEFHQLGNLQFEVDITPFAS